LNTSENLLWGHIKEFRRKFYLNRILRGSIVLLLIASSAFWLSVTGEGLLGFSSGVRTGLFFFLAVSFVAVAAYAVAWPLSKLLNLSKPLTDTDVATLVRRHFPDIDDKLVNLLELRTFSNGPENALLAAAIQKKTEELAPIPFAKAINLNVNWKLARYLAIPVLLFLLVGILMPDVLTNGTTRLLNYNQEFIPPPPFKIIVENHPGELIAGQDFTLEAKVEAREELPEDLYLYIKKSSESQYVHYPMEKLRNDEFAFAFNDIKENFNYKIGNEEVVSEIYGVEVLNRPAIKNFKVIVDYPSYTGMPDDTLSDNIGDIKVLRGTTVKWQMDVNGLIKSATYFGGDTAQFVPSLVPGRFTHQKQVLSNELYFINLISKRDIPNIDTVRYHIDVIQDRFPTVYVNSAQQEFQADFRMFMPLDFEISDDYGFSKLALYYKFSKSDDVDKVNKEYKAMDLKVDSRQLLQHKGLEVDLQILGMEEGDQVEYFVKVWDNDFVAGPKASTSAVFKINFPSLAKKFEEVDATQKDLEAEIGELVKDVKDIKESIEKFQDKMLEQKSLNYDDKKELENLLNKNKDVQDRIDKAQKEFKENKEKLQNNEMVTERTMEKYDKLQQLLEKLKDEKLDQYMKKLQEQMEKMDPKEMKKMMEEMQMSQEDLEKALERTLDLLKQLEAQQKGEEIVQKLDNLKEKQDMLNEKLEESKKGDDQKMNDIAEKQKKLGEEMKDVQKDLKELGDMKKETSTPDEEKMEELQKEGDDAQEEMNEAGDQIQKQDKKSGSESQKNSSKKMEKMKQDLEAMMQEGQQQQDEENMEDLRYLLENLLRLSFRQEDLRDNVKTLGSNDPMVVTREIEQKQLLDDMYMVKDSLDALAKRVFQIEKFVTDESRTILKSMEGATESMENKYIPKASENQHAAMTSINNLANMLTDVMQQMQEQMKNQKGGMGQCKKPGGNKPGMKDISKGQGQLNQMMQQMLQNGQGQDPKKLAEMGKMQEMLRQQLKDAHEQIGKNGKSGLGDMSQIMKDMQDTEDELENQILNERTMQRQEKILQRLLDSFKAVREKDELEERRESKTGQDKDKVSPDKLQLEEYKNKIRQELLKSNQLEYSSDFINLIEKYFKLLEQSND
jgi:hypothetical protein